MFFKIPQFSSFGSVHVWMEWYLVFTNVPGISTPRYLTLSVHCVYLESTPASARRTGEFLFKYPRYKLTFRSVVEKTETSVSREKAHANSSIGINLCFRIGKELGTAGLWLCICSQICPSHCSPLSLENLIHSRLNGVVVFICFENYFSHQIKLIYSKIDLILKIPVTLPQSIFSYAKYTHDIWNTYLF